MQLAYVTKFPSVPAFVYERVKIFRVDSFSRGLQKFCFTRINFRGKSRNAQNCEIY